MITVTSIEAFGGGKRPLEFVQSLLQPCQSVVLSLPHARVHVITLITYFAGAKPLPGHNLIARKACIVVFYDCSCYCCRAYKLGKKRWSYNQCELVLLQEGATRASELTVVEASQLQEAAEQSETRGSQVSTVTSTLAAAKLFMSLTAPVSLAGAAATVAANVMLFTRNSITHIRLVLIL